MTTYEETKELIEIVLNSSKEEAIDYLRVGLKARELSEPEFYDGIIRHGPAMKYTSDQWLDFHVKIPHWRLRRERALMDKLSPRQKEILNITDP